MFRRRKQATQRVPSSSKRTPSNNGVGFQLGDDVEQFVHSRQEQLIKASDPDLEEEESADEPEATEFEALPVIDVSDSEKEEEVEDDSSDEEQEGGENADGDGDEKDWGSRRHLWYGGDTYEYEIMENDEREEALREEEEEAIRLQKKAIEMLRPEDFGDATVAVDQNGDVDSGDVSNEDVDAQATENETMPSADAPVAAAPGIPILTREALECERKMEFWKPIFKVSDTAASLFHLYSSFVCNVAFYLSLHTDPEARHVDLRSHPVVARLVRIRLLLQQALKLPDATRTSWNEAIAHDVHGRVDAHKVAQETAWSARDDQNSTPTQNGTAYVEDKTDQVLEYVHRVFASKEDPAERKGETVNEGKVSEKKNKKRKRSGKRAAEKGEDLTIQVEEDDDMVGALLYNSDRIGEEEMDYVTKHRKQRKLIQLVNQMEQDRKNKEGKRATSADVDHIPNARRMTHILAPRDLEDLRADDSDLDDSVEDDDEVTQMGIKKEKKNACRARKIAEVTKPHVYTFDDQINANEKRRATSQVVKNRGFVRYRSRDKKTPRTKNRLAYAKAVKRRKSVAREYVGKPGLSYSGESSGINMSARKGSKLSSV